MKLVQEETGIKDINLVKMYALLVLVKGEDICLKDVHDAWAMNMNFKKQTERCYGHEHISLVPFAQLSPEVKAKDKGFVWQLRNAAKQLIKKEEKI